MHLVGCLYYCIRDARSHKHQTVHRVYSNATTYSYVIICFQCTLQFKNRCCFSVNIPPNSSSLWAIPFTFHAEYLIFCFFPFSRNTFLATVRRQVDRPVLSLHCGLEAVLVPQGGLTSPPLRSPVVGLPPFSLWTGMFCSISSADDGTVIPQWLGLQTLVS